jgi:pyrroline-5-carboxylate reductase
MHMKKKFSFVGAGKMASAIVCGMLEGGSAKASEIECSCGNDNTGKLLSEKTGISTVSSPGNLEGEILVLACKPQQLAEVAQAIGGAAPEIIVSILAGTTIARLRAAFPKAKNIVRVMPNLPALISKGVSCYSAENPLSDRDKKEIESLLSSIGESIECEEKDLDAVTALSGSGPGYIFEFAAAMIEAGIQLGLSPDVAKKLCIETFVGSSMLMKTQDSSPEDLRNAVSSPGGTTLAALDIFAKSGLRGTVEKAMFAAKNRASELSEM